MDIASIIYECKAKPNTYALIVRPDWKGLKNLFDSHIKLAEPSKVSKVEMTYHFSNGSKIRFGVVNDFWDHEKYQGSYFDFLDTDSIKPEYAKILEKRRRPFLDDKRNKIS